MANPFLSEIRIFGFRFAPQGWAFCNGSLLPINQNTALFSLLGTTYGGDGNTTFALPDLRGRAPFHFGNTLSLGELAGEETVTLNSSQMPIHTHSAVASSNAASASNPNGAYWAPGNYTNYAPAGTVAMAPQAVANLSGSQPHDNMSPFLVLNFCIALQGIFPSRN